MYKFNEELLQFIWRYKLLKPGQFVSTKGNIIKVVKPGELNLDAGPDFFNAQVEVSGITLVGNVEIHIRSSDWLKHDHQNNKNYDNIILHVVYEYDVEIAQNTTNNVEVLELKNLIEQKTLEAYSGLSLSTAKLPCQGQLQKVNDFKFVSWIERMTIERLEAKVKYHENLFSSFQQDYVQTFYTALLRSFGFKVNALPFELLAAHLPVTILLKHSDNLIQLEALLLGMAGFLEDQFEDKHMHLLQNEFSHLCYKYQLRPLQKEIFKFSKLRPANFPTVRLVQFAHLIHKKPQLITSPYIFASYDELRSVLEIEVQGYWMNRFKPDGAITKKKTDFGLASIESVIINTFAPFFFFYAKKTGKTEFRERSIELLNKCMPEENSKTKLFQSKKQLLDNAAGSQATINLYDNYCISKKCLQCGIGVALLNGK
jgi:hypothetical protein